jgi:hypothetical protein
LTTLGTVLAVKFCYPVTSVTLEQHHFTMTQTDSHQVEVITVQLCKVSLPVRLSEDISTWNTRMNTKKATRSSDPETATIRCEDYYFADWWIISHLEHQHEDGEGHQPGEEAPAAVRGDTHAQLGRL